MIKNIPGTYQFVSRHSTRSAADMMSIDLVYKTVSAANTVGDLNKGLHVEVVFTDYRGKTVSAGKEAEAEFAHVYLVSA
jgi:hypothetical protein